jgi:hypothetical protein
MQKLKLLSTLAIILILFSGILFGLIFVVPFLPLTLTQKGILVTILVAGMEIAWWVGVALVGKQVISKYSKQLNPMRWFKNNRGNPPKGDITSSKTTA